jgi:hypothetical protein
VLAIRSIPRNALWCNMVWNCFQEITLKELDCDWTHWCSFTFNILSKFFTGLSCPVLENTLKLSVNPDPSLAKVTQHPECLLWPPLVSSFLFPNVYEVCSMFVKRWSGFIQSSSTRHHCLLLSKKVGMTWIFYQWPLSIILTLWLTISLTNIFWL